MKLIDTVAGKGYVCDTAGRARSHQGTVYPTT